VAAQGLELGGGEIAAVQGAGLGHDRSLRQLLLGPLGDQTLARGGDLELALLLARLVAAELSRLRQMRPALG
jgi:hypothetical protein